MNTNEILIQICRDVELAVKALQAGEVLPDFQQVIENENHLNLVIEFLIYPHL